MKRSGGIAPSAPFAQALRDAVTLSRRTHLIAPFSRVSLLVVALCACRHAPAEPSGAPRDEPSLDAHTAPPAALDAQARRVVVALADGGAPAAATRAVRLELPTPPSVDVIAVRANAQWTVAALEPARVSLGISGAERILTLWRDRGHSPSASELGRVVGAFAYYPNTVYVSPEAVRDLPGSPLQAAPAATLVDRPGATGQSLNFSYRIDDGPGAGLHVAHFHVTQSGLIIDEAPNPTLR